MQRLILYLLLLTTICPLAAQKAGKFRGGIEAGALIPMESGFGLMCAAELKYNLLNQLNIGLRAEGTTFWKHSSHGAEMITALITSDYYFNRRRNLVSPFVGVGIGGFYCSARDDSAEEKQHTICQPRLHDSRRNGNRKVPNSISLQSHPKERSGS